MMVISRQSQVLIDMGKLAVSGWRWLELLLVKVLRGGVRGYQLTLSPLIGNQCRFYPSCSHYALDALATHGPWRGSWLAAKRLLRCQPLAAGGLDPVPTCDHAHSDLDRGALGAPYQQRN